MSNGERQVLVGVCAVLVKVRGASGNRARSLLVAADIDGDNILELEVPFQLWGRQTVPRSLQKDGVSTAGQSSKHTTQMNESTGSSLFQSSRCTSGLAHPDDRIREALLESNFIMNSHALELCQA